MIEINELEMKLSEDGFKSVFEYVSKGTLGDTTYCLWVNIGTGKAVLVAKMFQSEGFELYELSPTSLAQILSTGK